MAQSELVAPSITGDSCNFYRYAGVPVDFEKIPLNHNSDEVEFDNAVTAIRRNGVAIKGSIESKYGSLSAVSRNAKLRMDLDLFANVLHIKSYPSVRSVYNDVDLIIIRQNTQGEYSMQEHESVPGVVECLKVVTRDETSRLMNYACEYARAHGRKKITIVHKANIMKIYHTIFHTFKDLHKNHICVDNDLARHSTGHARLSHQHNSISGRPVPPPDHHHHLLSDIPCNAFEVADVTERLGHYHKHFIVFTSVNQHLERHSLEGTIEDYFSTEKNTCKMINRLCTNARNIYHLFDVLKNVFKDQINDPDFDGQ
ncbi:unnamed protein product, partial [Meganyctiphanes norvegica]